MHSIILKVMLRDMNFVQHMAGSLLGLEFVIAERTQIKLKVELEGGKMYCLNSYVRGALRGAMFVW